MILELIKDLFKRYPKIPLMTYYEFEELSLYRHRRLLDIALNENDEQEPVESKEYAEMVMKDIWRDTRKSRKRSLKNTRKVVGRKQFYTIPEVNAVLYGKPFVPELKADAGIEEQRLETLEVKEILTANQTKQIAGGKE